jgi:hypothetical protein
MDVSGPAWTGVVKSMGMEDAYGRCVADMVRLANDGALEPAMPATTRTFHEVTGEQPCSFKDFLQRDRGSVEAQPAAAASAVGGLLTRAREGIKSVVGKMSSQAGGTAAGQATAGGVGNGDGSTASVEPAAAATGIRTSPS